MPSGSQSYRQQIFNESGFVLLYPNVSEPGDILQSLPPNPFAESSTQLFPLGTKLIQGERVWRYCKNSSAALTIAGSLLQGPTSVHASAEDDIVIAASTGEAYAIGSYDVTITSTADIDVAPWSTKDGGKEGYIYINGGTGIGQMRKIKAHEALVTTGVAKFTVYEPWAVALIAADSECGLVENPYHNVIVAAAVTTGVPLGVNPIAVTASYYFWAQTGGPAAAICHAAIAYGTWAVVGTTAGEIDPGAAVTTEYIVGFMLTPGIKDNDAAAIFLTLDR